ncbi:MAG: hypothetical protein OHK0046_10810 [Anaerolineae bacterium]
MSKRKKKTGGPDLPQEALERARRQARGEEVDAQPAPAKPPKAESKPAAEPKPVVEKKTPAAPAAVPAAPRARAATPPAAARTTRQNVPERAQIQPRRRDGPMDNETMERLLANPTKFVSEEQLHQEYGYVLRDLRNMGVLAAALFVILVILAQFI